MKCRKVLIKIKLSGFAEIFTYSTMVSVLAYSAHYATSSLIWRNVWMCMMPFSAKSVTLKIIYIKKENLNCCHKYAIYFISWSEKRYISFVVLPLMKYAFFTSLDEINDIFIPKIRISSIYSFSEDQIRLSKQCIIQHFIWVFTVCQSTH